MTGFISAAVVRLRKAFASSVGASLVGFVQAGVGSILRTLQDKSRECVSVKDFGALGNGTTNDYPAIAAAITYLSSATNGGGRLFFPKGNYLCLQTLYLPQSIALEGEGMRAGPLGSGGNANVEGSCIIGKHSGAAVVSCKGSAFNTFRNICLYGDPTTPPKTGLCLGRSAGAASAGRHYFDQLLVAGYFSQAAIYSIASEENSGIHVHALVLGGGAKYVFYTSAADDLLVDAMVTSSNYSNQFYGINFLHQGNTANSAAIYMNLTEGCAGWLFKGGFTGMTSGTTSAHVQLHIAGALTESSDFTFEDVGCEAASNASPPIYVFRVSSAGTFTLKGLRITNTKTGQVLGGTRYYLYADDGATLDGAVLAASAPGHPSSVFALTNSNISLTGHDFTVRGGGAARSTINGKQVYLEGLVSAFTNNSVCAPVLAIPVFTGAGLNDLSFNGSSAWDRTSAFTGTLNKDYVLQIDNAGSVPNTFRWSDNGGLSWNASAIGMTGSLQAIAEGITVKFNATTGHTLNDMWRFTADPFLLPNSASKVSGRSVIGSGANGGIVGADDASYIALSASKSPTAPTFYMSGTARTGNVSTTQFFQNGNFSIGNATGTVTQLVVDLAAGGVRSGRDNVDDSGSAAFRWRTVYAGTGAINTSDERSKQQIMPSDAAVLRAWGKVKFCQYKFNDAVALKGDGARWHFGVIAQQVKAAFESEGLDPFAYGILCFDKWDALPEVLNEDGKIVQQARPAGERYGVRYDEALILECAYLRSRLTVLSA